MQWLFFDHGLGSLNAERCFQSTSTSDDYSLMDGPESFEATSGYFDFIPSTMREPLT